MKLLNILNIRNVNNLNYELEIKTKVYTKIILKKLQTKINKN